MEELADAILRYLERRYRKEEVTLSWDVDDPTVLALLTSHFSNASSPALDRLHELADEKQAVVRPAPPSA